MAKSKGDPFAKREAEKYENPIPSREFIINLLEKKERLMTSQDIEKALWVWMIQSKKRRCDVV